MKHLALIVGALAFFSEIHDARALDAFEIQVYGSEVAPPGGVGVETHINSVMEGSKTRSPEGELPTHHVSHVTLEPHLGITEWFEVGFYAQSAIQPGPRVDFAGAKLRAKVRYPGRIAGIFGAALNGEFAMIPARYEAPRLGTEIRPVLDVQWWKLYASVNPIIAVNWTGEDAGRPAFEPCGTVLFRALDNLSTGLEYYADLGHVDNLAAWNDQVHRIFAVVNVGNEPVAVHLAAGVGLSGEERFIFKAILTGELGD
jgi:hypothetical protein